MKNTLEIHNVSDSIPYCEAQGLANCFQAYADECAGESIMNVGFNPNSGCVYIALENGISICSMLGSGVEYLVTNFEDGEETFLESYGEAEQLLASMY
ncbi:MAG: hypothetical protein ACK5DE_07695 [Bacteroidota bacterium]|jgi:hypothetical protein